MLVQSCYHGYRMKLFPCVQSSMDTRGKNKWRWPRCKLKLDGKKYLYFLTIFHFIFSIIIKNIINKISFSYFPLYFYNFPYPYGDRPSPTHPSVCLSSRTPLRVAYDCCFRVILHRFVSSVQTGRRSLRNRTGTEELADSGCDRWALSPPNPPLTPLTSTRSWKSELVTRHSC